MTPRVTGRLVHHDPASRAYAAAAPSFTPASWLHPLGPVLDQGDTNACTGFTAADLLNSPLALANRRRYNAASAAREGVRSRAPRGHLTDADALELYARATRHDVFRWTYPPTDKGSSGLGAAKALKSLGVIDTYRWSFDFAATLAVAARQPVMLGLVWSDPMSDPDASGVIHIGTERQIKLARSSGLGHEVLLRGVRWDRKLARIRNHWGEDWGIGGDALIPLAELETLLMDYNGDVCVPEVSR